MKKRSIMLFLLIIGLVAFAVGTGAQEGENKGGPERQPLGRVPYNTTGGPDASGYRFYTSDSGQCDFQWIQSATLNTETFSTTDDDAVSVSIPFGFPFYDQTYSSVSLTTNGYLQFPAGATGGDFTEDCPLPSRPSSDGNGARIMTAWDDLSISGGNGHSNTFTDCPRVGSSGDPTEDCTILMLSSVHELGDTDTFWIETILYESGEIVTQFLDNDPLPTVAGFTPTIGIQSYGATSALTVSCGYNPVPTVSAGDAICFRREQTTNRTPSGIQNVAVTHMSWDEVSGEQWYHVLIKDSTGATAHDKWYEATNICNGTTCTIEAPHLTNDQYEWTLEYWQQARNTILNDGVSSYMLAVPRAGTINRVDPVDGTAASVPVAVLEWAHNPIATWYNVILVDDADNSILVNEWLEGIDACAGGFCAANIIVPPPSNTQVTWWMRAWGPGGMGEYNDSSFSHTYAAPTGDIGRVNPVDAGSVSAGTVALVWPDHDDIVWYHVMVDGAGGFTHDEWYHTGDVCNGTDCNIDVDLTTIGSYTWDMEGWNPEGFGNTDSTSFTVN